jgi:riboflavin synthase
MFTGLVTATGVVAARTSRGPGARLAIQAAVGGGPVELGESIAVDGCCLTVAATSPKGFEADLSSETLLRTTFGTARPGLAVNLERALTLSDRLGGHLVSGHVDGVATVVGRKIIGDAISMTFTIPDGVAQFIAEKGSIAVNGVSLTVNAAEAARFDVALIPVTLETTNLGHLVSGDRVNIEVDMIARYVQRLMAYSPSPAHPAVE